MNTLDYMKTDPQMRVYNEHRESYAHIANLIDICEAHFHRPCAGGECDMGDPCPRHARTPGVAERYLRLKARNKR